MKFLNSLLALFKKLNITKRSKNKAQCFEIANTALSSFRPNEIIDKDIFLQYSRRALLNAIAFCLYFDHTPKDWEFVRIFNLLETTKREIEARGTNIGTSLDFMYADKPQSTKNCAGWRELEKFNSGSVFGSRIVIQDTLSNFQTPQGCKALLTTQIKIKTNLKRNTRRKNNNAE